MERIKDKCIFLSHWMEAIGVLEIDLQDKLIANYIHYQLYGYHIYEDNSVIIAITNLWNKEIEQYEKENII